MECAPISSAAGGGRLDLAQVLNRIFKKSYNAACGDKRGLVARVDRAGTLALWFCAQAVVRPAPRGSGRVVWPREPGLGTWTKPRGRISSFATRKPRIPRERAKTQRRATEGTSKRIDQVPANSDRRKRPSARQARLHQTRPSASESPLIGGRHPSNHDPAETTGGSAEHHVHRLPYPSGKTEPIAPAIRQRRQAQSPNHSEWCG